MGAFSKTIGKKNFWSLCHIEILIEDLRDTRRGTGETIYGQSFGQFWYRRTNNSLENISPSE